jgi:hypothetical protein
MCDMEHNQQYLHPLKKKRTKCLQSNNKLGMHEIQTHKEGF